jgi:two-component system response regulator YesN
LISGHSDFDYARRAIKSKIVFEYILKPINFEELDKVISAAKKKILNFTGNDFPVLSSEEWRKFANDEKNDRIAKQAEIISHIKFSEIDEALEIFDETWKYMKRNNYTRTMVSRYCIELIMGLMELVMEQRNSREVLLEDPIPEINSKEIEEDIKQYTEKIMKTSSDIMARKENKDLSPIVNLALDYINENYSNREQSLNSLADKLNVSPNYLCLKFKEETGINYTKYLNGLRVKHAKELLKDVRLKVYMVSEKVGFEDTRYFSRIFRTYTGYTPTEFQKKEAIRRD